MYNFIKSILYIKSMGNSVKRKENLIIHIVTKDDPKKLINLLRTIKKNKNILNSDILIIDDSEKENIYLKNKLFQFNFRNLIYVNKKNWENIKKDMLKSIKNREQKILIKNLKLGKNGWNVHNTRNIGQIICKILFKKNRKILFLDGDMLIPKEFNVRDINIKFPKGIILKGSPDLSRLEWIRLYLGHFGSTEKNGYISRMLKKCNKKYVNEIINCYTDIHKTTSRKFKEISINPTREELNNGSYLNKIGFSSDIMYPSWFDSDWFWFQRLRKQNKNPIRFTDQIVIHDSNRKEILNSKMLILEEEGKIITTVMGESEYEDKIEKRNILKERDRRIRWIENTIEHIEQTEISGKIKKTIEAKLEKLIRDLGKLKWNKLIEKIASYEKDQRIWDKLLKNIDTSDKFKIIFFKHLNCRNIVFFSPHCDDIVISMGGILSEGHTKYFEIINVFTKTKYNLKKKYNKKNITKIRCEEEISIFKRFNVKPKFLGLKDATLREYPSEKSYMSSNNNPVKDLIFREARKKLLMIANKHKEDILFFPLGIGYNIDHSILYKIGEELMKKGYLVVFYEDIGYQMTENEKLVRSYIEEKDLGLISATVPIMEINSKVKIAKSYKSQISREIIKSIREINNKRGGERIWANKLNFQRLNIK